MKGGKNRFPFTTYFSRNTCSVFRDIFVLNIFMSFFPTLSGEKVPIAPFHSRFQSGPNPR